MEQLKEKAVIGPSITISGQLSGEEDLLIQGRVEGTVDLKNHNVTVGKNGSIKADIYGKIISIEGEVQGNLFSDEKIILRQSGVVRGNMTAPRVNLEDGAKFKGSIDMDSQSGDRQRTLSQAAAGGGGTLQSPPKGGGKKEVPTSKGQTLSAGAETP